MWNFRRRNNKHRKRNIIKHIIILFLIIVISIPYLYFQNKIIDVEEIPVKIENLPEELKGLRIVHISDVHIPKNGPDIENIINTVKEENPDLILITGDSIDSSIEDEFYILTEFLTAINDIAPTYIVSGNHEKRHNLYGKWEEAIKGTGVTELDNKLELFKKNGEAILLIGVEEGIYKRFKSFEEYEEYEKYPKIMLVHRPEEAIRLFGTDDFGTKVDGIFCGHAHGGQVNIPLLNRGVIAPGQGIFAKYVSGEYDTENGGKLIISRGLGNSGGFFVRINDRMHIPVVVLE